jgi:hypothetical protein
MAMFKMNASENVPKYRNINHPVCLVKQLKCLCKNFYQACSKISHTRARARFSSSSLIVPLSLIRRKACARAQFSRCCSTTNANSETGQMAVCCQNLTLGALSSRSALSVPVGAIFKKVSLFLNRSWAGVVVKSVRY